MAFPTTYTLTNLRNRDLSIDAKFSEDRALRRLVPANGTLTLDGSIASVDEMANNAQILQLINDGDLTVAMSDGPLVALTYSVSADAGTDAAQVQLSGDFPFEMLLTNIILQVPTGVATSTLQLADAASAGSNYTGAEDTDGTPEFVDATLQATRIIPAGSALWGLQSATAKPEVTLRLVGMRLSI